MLKLAAFDFDGTIADTLPMCIKAFRMSVLPYIGYEISETEIVQMFGLNETGMVKKVVKQDWEAALKDFYSNYELLYNEIIKHIEYLLQKYAIPKKDFCYIGDTTGDIKACGEAGGICLSAAWQKQENKEILEKENPDYVFSNVKDLQELKTVGFNSPQINKRGGNIGKLLILSLNDTEEKTIDKIIAAIDISNTFFNTSVLSE